MGWFGFGKEREVIDLSERYRKLKEQTSQSQNAPQEKPEQSSLPASSSSFFANLVSKQKQEKEQELSSPEVSEDAEERKKKLAKRLADMSDKIEELTSQIYKIQQRLEVLERKAGVSGFE